MGTSHARAYHSLDGFEIAGLVSRNPESRERLSAELGGYPLYDDFHAALRATNPDVVSINTYVETHAGYSIASMEAGAHVFVEKPLAATVGDARRVVETARSTGKKLVVGYILRVHPAWQRFTEMAQNLGKPLVMRMNLNQQSSGREWETHKRLMEAVSPIVDCGVHYVDVMCRMTRSEPEAVHCIGARLTGEIPEGMYNYGQLQIRFKDGSVGWYEAGWGPMMSENAFFIKDVIGPDGCIGMKSADAASDNVDGHTQTGHLRLHHAKTDPDGRFLLEDEIIDTSGEPCHDELCALEQRYLLDAIHNDLPLEDHWKDSINSLRIVLAADESFRTGKVLIL